jgi:hypothetical protein
MSKPVKKLFDMEIDEISLVDRPANQYGLIAFAKSAALAEELLTEEDSMPEDEIFSVDGESVDVDDLQHGDVVFDTEGNEYVFVEDEDSELEDDEFEDDEDEEDDVDFDIDNDVDKAFRFGNPANVMGAGKKAFGREMKQSGSRMTATRRALKSGYNQAPGAVLAGGAGIGAIGAGGYAMSKSLGDSVLEELSKAVSDSDREEIIAKAMDEIEIAKAAAEEAWAYAEQERDIRIEAEFISKAAEYNLPVAPEVFGPILKSLAETLSDEELDILDEIFTAIGDVLYDELGYVGESDNVSVYDTVDGMAAELVGKSDMSYEQAVSAMFEANPSAYDAYISENGR